MRNIDGLNRGNPGNAGGGRHTDKFKARMAKLSDSAAAWKFRRDVIEGNPIEERVIVDPVSGKEIKTLVTPSIENRRRMLADIDDRAYGKAAQSVDLSGLEDVFDAVRKKYK